MPRFRSKDNITADILGGCGVDSSDLAQTNSFCDMVMNLYISHYARIFFYSRWTVP
jgi:hypothetical protein